MLLSRYKGRYSLAFTTLENASQIADLFDEKIRPYKGRELWLIRPNGDLAWEGPSPYDKSAMLAIEEVRFLLLQALLFDGRIDLLDRAFWRKTLEKWLKSHPNPRFLEEAALDRKYEKKYLLSNVYRVFKNAER